MSDPRSNIEYMSDKLASITASSNITSHTISDPAPMPMERLEARICELAGHLTAATCQFLMLVADFDAREGWAGWEMPSCAAWLSWQCQVAPGTAREQVRVARALGGFPLMTAEFAAGRLSYAKVRALTRIATPETEADLLQMAIPMTASQIERFARAHRRVTGSAGSLARPARKLTWHRIDDLDFAFRAVLPPEAAAVVLQALRAARDDLEHPHEKDDADGAAFGADGPPESRMETAENLADALVQVCSAYLSGKAATADNPDTYQVIIHAGAAAITPGSDAAEELSVSAETWPGGSGEPGPGWPIWHPAYRWRCHIEDGPAISPATLHMIGCDATISLMVHDADGNVIAVGDRTRKPSAKLRRAVRERDGHRCRFPGCESRRVDIHHIVYWSNGGKTRLDNLISLCKRHHALVHDKGLMVAVGRDGFGFYTRHGLPLRASPPLPQPTGDITACHDVTITP